MNKQGMTTKYIAQGAVIAAIYAVLTLALAPISYGVMQVRVSEALCVLPFFTPAAVPGLFLGCVLSNMLGPYGLVDTVTGSCATLIAAFCTYKIGHPENDGGTLSIGARRLLAPLPPVIANAVIVGATLHYVYGIDLPLPLCMLWVGIGEAIACYVIGYPLLRVLEKHRHIFE